MKTFAHITDVHLQEAFPASLGIDSLANWSFLIEFLRRRGIKHIVFGGDIGEPSAHEVFFKSLDGFKTDIVLGNHDQHLFKTFTKAAGSAHYYYHEDEHYRYIILDSSTETVAEEQLKWLEQTIITTKKIILFVHHPILSVPSYVETHHALTGREQIKALLHSTKTEITVFCGHYHLEDERAERNIRQLVTPAVSYQMHKTLEKSVSNTQFGCRLVYISAESIDTEVFMFDNR